jgi:hypothetical protein
MTLCENLDIYTKAPAATINAAALFETNSVLQPLRLQQVVRLINP